MAFDLSTAKDVQGGFDVSSSQPIGDESSIEYGSEGRGIAEAALAVGSPLTGDIVGGLAGLVAQLSNSLGITEAQGGDVVRQIQDAMSYEPKTVRGKQKLDEFLNTPLIKKAADFMQQYQSKVSEVADPVGAELPIAGAAIQAMGKLPTAIPEGAGAGGAIAGVPKAASAAIKALPQGAEKQKIGELLATGQTPAQTAGYQLQDPELRNRMYEEDVPQYIEGLEPELETLILGEDIPLLESPDSIQAQPKDSQLTRRQKRVIKFPEAKRLKKQGFEDKSIAAWQDFTADESKIASNMTRVKRAASQNENEMRQPLTLVGDALAEQIQILQRSRNKAARDIQKSLNNMKGEKVDYAKPLEDWRNKLEGQGIVIRDNITPDGVQWEVDLSRSRFADQAPVQGLLNTVKDRLQLMANEGRSFSTANAEDLHELKKLIDYRLDWGKLPSDNSLTTQAQNLVKGLRADINKTLQEASPEYKAANQDYAKSITPLAELNEATGRTIDVLDENISPTQLGQDFRKVITNYQSAPLLAEGSKNLFKEAKARGYDKNINLAKLVILNNTLDKRFGVSSSKGGTMAGLLDPRRTNIDRGMEVAEEGVKKARKINNEQAFEDLINLFETKSK